MNSAGCAQNLPCRGEIEIPPCSPIDRRRFGRESTLLGASRCDCIEGDTRDHDDHGYNPYANAPWPVRSSHRVVDSNNNLGTDSDGRTERSNWCRGNYSSPPAPAACAFRQSVAASRRARGHPDSVEGVASKSPPPYGQRCAVRRMQGLKRRRRRRLSHFVAPWGLRPERAGNPWRAADALRDPDFIRNGC